jgi:hypothetical protein
MGNENSHLVISDENLKQFEADVLSFSGLPQE